MNRKIDFSCNLAKKNLYIFDYCNCFVKLHEIIIITKTTTTNVCKILEKNKMCFETYFLDNAHQLLVLILLR